MFRICNGVDEFDLALSTVFIACALGNAFSIAERWYAFVRHKRVALLIRRKVDGTLQLPGKIATLGAQPRMQQQHFYATPSRVSRRIELRFKHRVAILVLCCLGELNVVSAHSSRRSRRISSISYASG